ncbi:hypothetical protein Bbelb_218600 [Branchiostoma belcheri]|nr:hypothetical protein Bbelb_218600 [Branchiostoma belcheri]
MKIPTLFLVAILVIAVGSQHMTKKSADDHKRAKRAVPAFLVAAAKEIGGKVVSKLGDRIANGVVENHQEKVVSGLQSYLGKQMDKFDDEYKDLLKDTSGLAAGLNRPVEEADIQLVNGRGAMMGNMYAPPSWEIRHKYKYKDDSSDEDKDSSGGEAAAFTYPAGLGPVLMNGCFGTGYKNGDPCYKAKIPRTGCPINVGTVLRSHVALTALSRRSHVALTALSRRSHVALTSLSRRSHGALTSPSRRSHVALTSLSRRSHVALTSLSRRSHGALTALSRRSHVALTALSRRSHVALTALSRRSHVALTSLSRRSHVALTALSRRSHVALTSLSRRSHVALTSLSRRSHVALTALSRRSHVALTALSRRSHGALTALSRHPHVALTSLSRRSHVALTSLSRRPHGALTALSRRSHVALTSLSRRSHVALTSLSRRSHVALTALSRRSLGALTSLSRRSHGALTSLSRLSHVALTALSRRPHVALTSLSRRSHGALTSLSRRSHGALTALSRRSHVALTALSRRSHGALTSLSLRSLCSLHTFWKIAYGKNEVPDSMTVQGIYDTDVESYTFRSTEEYRQYLAEKSAVTSARAMFQEEMNKASGYAGGGGPFGLIASGGRGYSSQSGTSSQLSGFSASSSASGQLSEKQTQTFMAMLEINIFRYEIFMDDVTPGQLNVGFLRDFISLPESYFSSGAELIFQNFYLRWGTHYIKSAKFGGQLKIIKTKQATQDLSMSEFATRAEADWKMTLSTFSAQASQTKSSSWFHDQDSKTESKQSSGQAASGSESQANRQEETQASAQEYSNEVLVVQGGDQQIAAAITEMYTTALTTELKDWLESIDDYPKPFSFVLRLVSDLLNIPFDSLFPAGEKDYGCLGSKNLKIEKKTGRKYYIQETAEPADGDKGTKNGTETVAVSEIRYCNFENRKTLEDSMTKRRMALQRAVTVYLEEGRLLSSDFLLPAGEAGCETAMLAFLQGDNTGVPTWEDMIGGKEFTVVFDMPYDILGILQAQDVVTLKFFRYKWFSSRKGFVPHLYDGYKNGKSNDVKEKKVSVQGLVMTYNEGSGVFTVTDDDFKESALLLKDLPDWVNGRDVARADDTVGDVPCSIHWSNAHRFDPTDGGKCIHFTAASEGDIFVVFASIPQNHETWIYIQISPEGVALYKAMRLQTTQLNDNAGGLGSATLYQSYFVCVTEDVDKKTTAVQYGKTPDNEERPHVWLSFKFNELASLRYYSFGSGESPVKVMGLSLLDRPAKDFIICREGTEMVDGVCQQKCHPECEGCRTSGSDSPTDCIACKHLKMSYPYRPREEQVGAFECVAECPQHMESDTATKSCTCE